MRNLIPYANEKRRRNREEGHCKLKLEDQVKTRVGKKVTSSEKNNVSLDASLVKTKFWGGRMKNSHEIKSVP